MFVSSAAIVAIAGLAVVAAQHRPPAGAHAAATHIHGHILAACTDATDGGRIPSHMVDALGLTQEQTTTLAPTFAEACSSITRLHTKVHDVLTAEQKATLAKMHGDHEGAVASLMKKLHGSK